MIRPEGLLTLGISVGLALIGCGADATMVPLLSFDQILLESDLIVEGTVASVDSRWAVDGNTIHTYVTFHDRSVIYGQPPNGELTLRFEGGRVGGYELITAGVPSFAVGDRELLMIKGNNVAVSPVVGFFQGRFRIVGEEVQDYGGRPIIRIDDNVLVSLGTGAANAASNSPGISQGLPDERPQEFSPGSVESPATEAAERGEVPASKEDPREPLSSEATSAQPPPFEAQYPGVVVVRTSPGERYPRYLDPADDPGTRLSAREFVAYINRRLSELGRR